MNTHPPHARAIRAQLLSAMRNGEYAHSERLPRESALAVTLGISRTQLRDVLASLEREGFITRRHGVGTIINRHVLDVQTGPVREAGLVLQGRPEALERAGGGVGVIGSDLTAAFGVFLTGVAVCMVKGVSLVWALAVGFVCFFGVALGRGFHVKELAAMAWKGMGTSMKVLRILTLLGLLTALWRASGTVAVFVWTGAKLITPRSFVLIAFLLSSVFCMAFGSCFGVAGTAGVILMAIARGGGANLTVTAGAIMSGIYVGERLSPASSSAALTAAMAGVDQREFQQRMWRTTPIPLLLATAVYGEIGRAHV